MLACNWSKHVMWPNIPWLKLGNIWEYSPVFKTKHVAKKIQRIINITVPIWHANMHGYLSLDIFFSSKPTIILNKVNGLNSGVSFSSLYCVIIWVKGFSEKNCCWLMFWQPEWKSSFLKLRSRKNACFSEHMSADKYPSIFSHEMEAIVYLVQRHMITDSHAL